MKGGQDKGGAATRLLVVLLLIVPAALLSYLGYKQAHQNMTKLVLERRDDIAELAAATLKERFDRVVDVSISLTSRPSFREEVETERWDAALAGIQDVPELFPYIERVALTSATGTLMADSLPGNAHLLGQNFAQHDWYAGVSKEWKPYVSEVYRRQGEPAKNVISVAAPIRSAKDEHVTGILILQMPLDAFFNWSHAVDVGPQGFIYYVDQHGHVASHPKYAVDGPIIDYSSVPAVQKALAGESGEGELYDPVEKELRLAAWENVPGYGWGVIVTQPIEAAYADRDASLRNLLLRDLVFLLLILIAALALMYLLDRLDRQLGREKAMLDSMGEGLAVTDRDDKITYMNPAGAQILHLTPEAALGRRWMEVAGHPKDLKGVPIPEEDRGTKHALKGEKAATVTYRYTRPDGTEFTSVATAAPIMHEGAQIGVIVVFQDITAEIETERERAELLSIASHQMRTPLTVIRWIAEMLLRGDVGKLTRDQRKQIGNLKETGDRLGSLVNDMLNVSRLESGKLTAIPAPTDLAALLKKAAEEVAPLAAEKKQKFEVKVPRLPKLTIDGRLIGEATTNLLSNAIKYTPEGGRVALTAELRARDVLVSVRDTGIGIPPAQQADVFRKFFRADNAVESGAEGTGLGLYVVKQIVELSGGTLKFESVQGKGTTFFYTLPLPKK